MPLTEIITEKLDKKEGEAWYSSVDMTYAYGKVPLQEITKKLCKFQMVGGNLPGTNHLITRYYGLTVMPTEFQKVMDVTLVNINIVFVYINES